MCGSPLHCAREAGKCKKYPLPSLKGKFNHITKGLKMKRKEGESFEDYKIRRTEENNRVKRLAVGTAIEKGNGTNRITTRKTHFQSKHFGSANKYISPKGR